MHGVSVLYCVYCTHVNRLKTSRTRTVCVYRVRDYRSTIDENTVTFESHFDFEHQATKGSSPKYHDRTETKTVARGPAQ